MTGTANDRYAAYTYTDGGDGTEQAGKTVHNGLDDTGSVVTTTTYTYDLQGRLDTATIETYDGGIKGVGSLFYG